MGHAVSDRRGSRHGDHKMLVTKRVNIYGGCDMRIRMRLWRESAKGAPFGDRCVRCVAATTALVLLVAGWTGHAAADDAVGAGRAQVGYTLPLARAVIDGGSERDVGWLRNNGIYSDNAAKLAQDGGFVSADQLSVANASNAANATRAASAGSADIATFSTSAGSAATAAWSTNAGWSSRAAWADGATSANTATRAGTADSATVAGFANSAGTAGSADSANRASTSAYADNSGRSNTSGYADNSGRSNTSAYADNSGSANNAGGPVSLSNLPAGTVVQMVGQGACPGGFSYAPGVSSAGAGLGYGCVKQ